MSKQNIGYLSPAEWSAVLQMPLAHPPQGVKSNFTDPQYHGQSVIALAAICLSWLLALLCVRIYVKARITRNLTPDDYVYCLSWPAGVACICLFLAIDTGGVYGYHGWDVQIGDLTKPIIIRSQVLEYLYGPFCWLIRLSLFAMIYFTFAPLWWTKRMVIGGIVVSGLVYLSPTPVYAVICRPRGGTDQLAYIAGMASEQCANTQGVGVVLAIVVGVWNVVVDLYLLALPIPAIRRLNVNRKKKVAIYAVFGAATLGCIVGVVVLAFRIGMYGEQDVTYHTVPMFDACIVEMTVGLTIPCAASFYALWQHYQTRIQRLGSSQVTQTTNTAYSGRSGDSEKKLDTTNTSLYSPSSMETL